MPYRIKSRVWIEFNGNIFLGEGRVELLKAIEKTGSLSKAAKILGMSYNKAWKLIDSFNNTTEKPVVVKNTGGKGGGGTKITPYGKQLIDAFERINKNCWKFLDKQASVLDFLLEKP